VFHQRILKGPFKDFHKTVCAMISIYKRSMEKDKNFKTHLNKIYKELDIERIK
jgi:hypothetical protein